MFTKSFNLKKSIWAWIAIAALVSACDDDDDNKSENENKSDSEQSQGGEQSQGNDKSIDCSKLVNSKAKLKAFVEYYKSGAWDCNEVLNQGMDIINTANAEKSGDKCASEQLGYCIATDWIKDFNHTPAELLSLYNDIKTKAEACGFSFDKK